MTLMGTLVSISIGVLALMMIAGILSFVYEKPTTTLAILAFLTIFVTLLFR